MKKKKNYIAIGYLGIGILAWEGKLWNKEENGGGEEVLLLFRPFSPSHSQVITILHFPLQSPFSNFHFYRFVTLFLLFFFGLLSDHSLKTGLLSLQALRESLSIYELFTMSLTIYRVSSLDRLFVISLWLFLNGDYKSLLKTLAYNSSLYHSFTTFYYYFELYMFAC